ncbi:MAG: dihydrofolate reductase, partial [Treponemataceae bacterium]|nr:dihydrofolate reductase [Treponemataceae bacterium]
AGLYAEALALAETLYLTEIEREYDGDVFFPAVDAALFEKVSAERHGGAVPYTYLTYRRVQPAQ